MKVHHLFGIKFYGTNNFVVLDKDRSSPNCIGQMEHLVLVSLLILSNI